MKIVGKYLSYAATTVFMLIKLQLPPFFFLPEVHPRFSWYSTQEEMGSESLILSQSPLFSVYFLCLSLFFSLWLYDIEWSIIKTPRKLWSSAVLFYLVKHRKGTV